MYEIFSVLTSARITIPSYEVIVVLIILTLCFLHRAFRLGLLVSFFFAFHLGWLYFSSQFDLNKMGFVIAYTVFGVFVLLLAVYQMFFEEN